MVYKLTEGDRALFKTLEDGPDVFTDFYFRSEDSGTYWRPVEIESEIPEMAEILERWRRGYKILKERWEAAGRPPSFVHKNKVYHVIMDKNGPIFHHRHGVLFLDWAKKMWNAPQSLYVILGGMGSSKTWHVMMLAAIKCVTKKRFSVVVVAMHSIQVAEVYNQFQSMLSGTELERRFVKRYRERPQMQIVFESDYIGESTITFYSIRDDYRKLLNLSFDMAYVEQAEAVEDLDGLLSTLATRSRGQIGGREREGTIYLVANARDNPALWDLFDQAEQEPDRIMALQPSIYENVYVTPAQLAKIESIVGKDPNRRREMLFGQRPIGSGEHFPAQTIKQCHSKSLDDMLETALREKKRRLVARKQTQSCGCKVGKAPRRRS